jgi:hypothetical protein
MAAVALATLLIGCGGDRAASKRVPVSGTVTLDKEPLAGARVIFMPTKSTVGNNAEGITDTAGHYRLAGGRDTGLPAGDYKVVISRRLLKDGSPAPADTPAEVFVTESLPAPYSNRDTTRLTATVPENGATLDFPLTKTGK